MASNKEEELLRIAARIFREKGFHKTSVQEIAVEAAMFKAGLYYYVSSKQELLFKILERGFVELQGSVDDLQLQNLLPRARLQLLVRNHVAHVLSVSDFVKVFLHEVRYLSPELRGKFIPRVHIYEDLFTQTIADCVKQGEFRPDIDPAIESKLILGMCNWLTQWYSSNGRLSWEQIADAIWRMVLEGLTQTHAQVTTSNHH